MFGREMKFRGAMQRYRDDLYHDHRPWWRFRWTAVLALAVVAIYLNDDYQSTVARAWSWLWP